MTELAPAGWYDDTTDAEQLRWWTGTAWTDARAPRQPAPATESPAAAESPAEAPIPLPYGPASVTGRPAASPVPSVPIPSVPEPSVPVPSVHAAQLPVAPAAPPPGQLRLLRLNNPFAFTSVIIGLVSLVLNVLGGPAVVAIVFGVLGLVRSRKLARAGAPITGLVASIIGIALGLLMTLRFVTDTVMLLQHVYR